ncbi:helix-turn-helix transcriptional regulator [Bradyrhizobium sp. PUT101]|uniref:helix-turn-helix transcriptional regulator n=1 Tax=Bradyrhizobium sp. PUT101 TaxID=3447427 RepID=UPI003F8694C7
MRKTPRPAPTVKAKFETAKVKGKLIREDQDAKHSTARRIHRPQSKSGGGEDDDSPVVERPRRMLTVEQVLAIVPVGRTTLWRMERRGSFPPSTYISRNRAVWYEDEIIAWQNQVDERVANRRRGPGRPRKRRTEREQAEA